MKTLKKVSKKQEVSDASSVLLQANKALANAKATSTLLKKDHDKLKYLLINVQIAETSARESAFDAEQLVNRLYKMYFVGGLVCVILLGAILAAVVTL